MSAEEFDEMGPIDYLLVEWPGRQPTGEAAPLLLDLVDRGLIRILDLALLSKAEDGSVTRLEVSDHGDGLHARRRVSDLPAAAAILSLQRPERPGVA